MNRTEQNNGFTAFDTSAVTFDSIGEVFATGCRRRSSRQMTVLPELTLAAASFLSVKAFGHWPSIRETMHFAETAGGGEFRRVRSTVAVRVVPSPRLRATPAPRPLTLVHMLGDNSLSPIAYRRCNTCASLAHARRAFAAAGNLRKRSTRYGDSQVIASPRKKQLLNAGLRAEAAAWDAAAVSA